MLLWASSGGDPFVLALIGLLLHVLLAGLPGIGPALGAPLGWLRAAARWSERRLNRSRRGDRSLAVRGTIAATVFGLGAAALGYGVWRAIRAIPPGPIDGRLAEAICVMIALDVRGGLDRARGVILALGRNDVDAARAALAGRIVGDAYALDEHGLYRGAVEVGTRRLCDGLADPIFWYLLLGLPGLFASRALAALAWESARPAPRFAPFGNAAATAHRLAAYIPDALAGLGIVFAAAFAPSASPRRAAATMVRDAHSQAAAGAGWSLGAAAGALDLSLGGPVRDAGDAVALPWIGDGRARASAADARRGLYLDIVVILAAAGALGLFALAGST